MKLTALEQETILNFNEGEGADKVPPLDAETPSDTETLPEEELPPEE